MGRGDIGDLLVRYCFGLQFIKNVSINYCVSIDGIFDEYKIGERLKVIVYFTVGWLGIQLDIEQGQEMGQVRLLGVIRRIFCQ